MMRGEPRIVGDGVGSEPSQGRRRAWPQGHADIHLKLKSSRIQGGAGAGVSDSLAEQLTAQHTTFQNTMQCADGK